MSQFLFKTIGFALNSLSLIAPKFSVKKSLQLFSTPRKGRVSENQKEFLNTSKQEVIYLNNIAIQTYHWKAKQPKASVLMAHGWESNSFRWRKLSKQLLEQNYNIIALDAPAHGKSGDNTFTALKYAEFINQVCKTYNPTHIIGHSVGGMAGIFFLHNFKDTSIKKIVTLGSPSEFDLIFLNYTTMMGYNKTISKGLDNYIFDTYGKYPSGFSSAKFSEKISAKGLIIHDVKDKVIPFNEAKLIHKHYKNSTLLKTEGFGHGLKDQSVNNAIIKFLNQE